METGRPIMQDMSISPLLREMASDHGSLRKLAGAMKMSPGGLSKIMNGKNHPSAPTCRKIARVSGKTIDEVFDLAYDGPGDVRTDN